MASGEMMHDTVKQREALEQAICEDGAQPDLTVFYNSACPVCKAGIASQSKKSTACAIEWLDVHNDNEAVSNLDRTLPTVRKYLHLQTADGEVLTGIDAFIELWRNSPKERWLAKVFSFAPVKAVAKVGYFMFANLLYTVNRIFGRW